MGSDATTCKSGPSVASEGGLSGGLTGGLSGGLSGGLLGSWDGSGAFRTRFTVKGKSGLVGALFHQLYKAPPTTNRATPTSMVEEAVI